MQTNGTSSDIYCDTRMILSTLERIEPEPKLYPAPYEAMAHAVAYWAENQLFRPISLYVSGSNSDVFPLSLQADRAAMRGLPPPNADGMARAAARSAPKVRAQLALIEQMLSDGRRWIVGPTTTIADFSVYHALWFITGRTNRLAHELDSFHRTQAWMERMAHFGHGRRQLMTSEASLAIAAAATPLPPDPSEPFAEDPPLGARVRIRADDYGKEPVEGALVMINAHEIAVGRKHETLGAVTVHFPRLGYDLREI